MGVNPVCLDRQSSTFSSELDGRVFLCPPPRMLKKSASGVLASFRPSTYPRGYASDLHSLRPCWTDFLSILLNVTRLDVVRMR
jgi:hypothetical protein